MNFDNISGYVEGLEVLEYIPMSGFDKLAQALSFDKQHGFLSEEEVTFITKAYLFKCPDFFSDWDKVSHGYICDTKAHKFKFIGPNHETKEGVWQLL